MRSRDSRGFRNCISVYLNGLYLLCRLLLKHELGLTLKIFRQKFPQTSKAHTAPHLTPHFRQEIGKLNFTYSENLQILKNLQNFQFFAFLTISSSLISFFSLSLSLSLSKKRKILAEVKMKKLDVNHGGTSYDASFSQIEKSLCPVSLSLGSRR